MENQKKHPSNIDVAVLMLFFSRADLFGKVFEQVRKARPSKLFLYQDGAREGNERDKEGIAACRAICADDQIDWECEVYRHYCDHNQGCDPSEYLSQKWAFSIVDKCIVLEDDDLPAQSFFPFCKEMLDRYEHDNRIGKISGMNIDEVTPDVSASYFFTSAFCISGWASWRRVVDQWEGDYGFLDDEETVAKLRTLCKTRGIREDFLPMCYAHRASGKEHYESIFWASQLLHSQMAIMPQKNQITNIGLSADSTHFVGGLETTPRGLRRIFTLKPHELQFPLRHPRYVIENTGYKDRYYRANAWGHPWVKVGRSFEELWLNLRCGNFQVIRKAISKRIKKWMGNVDHG